MHTDHIIATYAERYVKDHEKELIRLFADPNIFASSTRPISVFMAGSPGAGKTEFSRRLVEHFLEDLPIRIDADDIRAWLPEYHGHNAHLFQKACTVGVNKLLDYAIRKNVNFILDGTFAYSHALKNIERCLQHKRRVVLFYLFQNPSTAWKFTKAREAIEGRRVTKDVFITAFLKAQENVNRVKILYQDQVELTMVVKDFRHNSEIIHSNILSIDSFLPKRYTREELEEIL